MKLSELFLDRFLYRDNNQNLETKSSEFNSLNNADSEPVPISSGGAAEDINNGNVEIDGANIEDGTLPASTLNIANWGWGQTCPFSNGSSSTIVTWNLGVFTSASGDAYNISAGTTPTMSQKTYIYLDINVSTTTYRTTTTPSNAVGLGKVLVAVAKNQTPPDLATYNTVEANQIIADNILANTIDASKINVGQLSAISVDAGDITAGTITGLTVTGGILQTSALTTVNRIIITGVDNSIGFWSSDDTLVGQIETWYNPLNYAGGITITSPGGQFSTDGKSNLGNITMRLPSSVYFGLDWYGGSTATERIVTNGKLGADWTPHSNNYYNLGASTLRWSNLHITGITLSGVYRTTWPTASMTYPSAGIALSTGSSWGTSITNNSSNWNTAYGWGNHASAGYALLSGATFSGAVTLNGGATIGTSDVLSFNSGAYIDEPKAIYMSQETSAPGGVGGGVYYNTTVGALFVHDGTSWKEVAFV